MALHDFLSLLATTHNIKRILILKNCNFQIHIIKFFFGGFKTLSRQTLVAFDSFLKILTVIIANLSPKKRRTRKKKVKFSINSDKFI